MPDETRVRLNGIEESAKLCRMMVDEVVALDGDESGTLKSRQEKQKRLLGNVAQTLTIIQRLSSTEGVEAKG